MFVDPRMVHPDWILKVHQARWGELLKEAQGARLAREISASRPRLTTRLATGVGKLLVSTGQRLQGAGSYPCTCELPGVS